LGTVARLYMTWPCLCMAGTGQHITVAGPPSPAILTMLSTRLPQVKGTESARTHDILHLAEHCLPVTRLGRFVGHVHCHRRVGKEPEESARGWVEPVSIRHRRVAADPPETCQRTVQPAAPMPASDFEEADDDPLAR